MTLDFDPIDEAAANWRGAGWAAVDAMTAATSITRAHQILSGRIDAALAPVGLNFSRFEVLALLSFTKESKRTVTRLVTRLVTLRKVVTQRNNKSRREDSLLSLRIPRRRCKRSPRRRIKVACHRKTHRC